MAGNIQDVSFSSPTALIAPDIAVQQQQLARRQALADALRQQVFEPIDAGGGRISWTQGAAKLAQALVGRSEQKKIDAQQVGLSRQYAGAIRGMFGLPGTNTSDSPANGGIAGDLGPSAPQPTPPPAPASDAPQQPAPPAPPAADPQGLASVLSGMKPEDGSANPYTPGSPPAGAPQPAMAAAVRGDPPTASAPPQPVPSPSGAPPTPPVAPPAGGAPSRGPWSLSSNQQADFADYMLNPEKYGEAVIASHTPTDFAKLLTQSGIDPQSPMGRQLMQQQLMKQNYVAPVNGRPGATIRDPFDPTKVVGYDAPTIEGAFPNYGPNGMPTGYSQAPGAAGAIGAVAGAKASANAAYDPQQVFNPQTGQAEFRSKQDVALGRGAPGGGAYAAGPALGTAEFAGTMGKGGAQYFNGLQSEGADANNRVFALKQMLPMMSGPTQFGPGTDTAVKFAGVVNGIGKSLGLQWNINAQNVTNVGEFNKIAAQYSARAAQDLGMAGSDKRIDMTVAATPNAHMTNQAMQHVIPIMIGLEGSKAGMAAAGQAFAQAHPGPNAQGQFLTQWRAAYDPRIYIAMAQGPAAVKQLLKGASPADRQQLVHKSQMLASMGALSQ